MTFPVKFEDAASSDNFPIDMRVSTDLMTRREEERREERGLYQLRRGHLRGLPLLRHLWQAGFLSFGYGLSYTTFAYDKAAVKADNGVYTVSVEVKNTGKVAGKEVVQLYVSAPDVAANKPERN